MSQDVSRITVWERDAYRGLVSVANTINTETDLERLLVKVMETAQAVMSAEAATVFLVDEATGDLVLRATSSDPSKTSKIIGLRVPKGQGISGWCYANRRSDLVKDAWEDPRFFKDADKKTGIRTRSIMTAPLFSRDKCLGVVQVLNPSDRPHFEEHQLPVFEAYAALSATAIENIRLMERELSNVRTQQELEIAADIQKNFMPEQVSGGELFDVAVLYRPARTIGGDFYDFHQVDARRSYLLIGDVSGKGVPASLLMAQVLSQIRVVSRYESSPGAIFRTVNNMMIERQMRGLFVTASMLVHDAADGSVRLANAGHFPPLVLTGGRVAEMPSGRGLPLGIMPDVEYEEARGECLPGDSLLLYSDGLVEMRNRSREDYGLERVIRHFEAAGGCPYLLINLLQDDLENFKGAAAQHDDLTIVSISRKVSLEQGRTLRISSDPRRFGCVRTLVRSAAASLGFGDKEVNQMVLAVDEAVTNIYRHAYCQETDHPIFITVRKEGGDLVFSLEDRAPCSDLSQFRGRDLEDIRPGGLGVHFIRTVMDQVDLCHCPDNRGNILTLRKKIPSGCGA